MLKRVVIGAALACLMSGAAYAQDDTAPMEPPAEEGAGAAPAEGAGAPAAEPATGDDECSQRLAAAEEAVTNKQDASPMSDDEYAKVNELLDQADAQCTEGNLKDATATLATVTQMIAK
jgi:hypothetical protein